MKLLLALVFVWLAMAATVRADDTIDFSRLPMSKAKVIAWRDPSGVWHEPHQDFKPPDRFSHTQDESILRYPANYPSKPTIKSVTLTNDGWLEVEYSFSWAITGLPRQYYKDIYISRDGCIVLDKRLYRIEQHKMVPGLVDSTYYEWKETL